MGTLDSKDTSGIMSNTRTENSIRNIMVAYSTQFLQIVLKFVVRTVFVLTLSKEYLGLNGLFSNVLQFFALAELGIGPAITFCLYKPIAHNDNDTILALMRVFKKAYCCIGFFILGAGLVTAPFIESIVKDVPNIPYFKLIYLMFVVNSAVSYFYSYREIFVTANQRDYVVTSNKLMFDFLCGTLQVVFLLTTHEYLYFLIIQILTTVGRNINISRIAKRDYPVLLENRYVALDEENKWLIKENIAAMIFHKIGAVFVFSSSHILMSKLFGLVVEGLYSNYALIISAVEELYGAFFRAITASVGNLRATSDKDNQLRVFKNVFFINFVGITFATVCLLVLFNPFITLWVGEQFCFDNFIVYALVTYFYFRGMRCTCGTFNGAFGLMRCYKSTPIPEVIINIGSAIWLSRIYGPAGIFMGGIISTILICLWIEPYVLFKYGFPMSLRKYFMIYVRYLLSAILIVGTCYWCGRHIVMGGFGGIALRLLMCIIVTAVWVVALYSRTNEFRELVQIGKRILRR